MRTTVKELQRPCGDRGLAYHYHSRSFTRPTPDISDCLVSRPKPFNLVIWEPIPTKAPGPNLASPFCCYISTVIFYHRPNIVRPWKTRWRGAGGKLQACSGGFEEWDHVETRLTWDDIVRWQGEDFDISGGTVKWAAHPNDRVRPEHRWWMLRTARRRQARAA